MHQHHSQIVQESFACQSQVTRLGSSFLQEVAALLLISCGSSVFLSVTSGPGCIVLLISNADQSRSASKTVPDRWTASG